ncbi:hypothetical protein Tco_0227437 [Tanacetum coccineum]
MDFHNPNKSLAKEADESLEKIKVLEIKNERLLRAIASQDIMSIMQNNSVVDKFDQHTELDRTKEKLEYSIIKKEKEYATLWNDWYKKSQLGDLKGKSINTQCASNTLGHLSQNLEDKNVSLEFQVKNYAKENAHLKTTYKNLFDSINVVQICIWCIDSGCSKHMTGNLKLLINFSWKFLGTVRFGNDHIAAIMGYGDLQWRNILITRVYFVEGLGHNLFLVGQLCDSDLEVAFRRNTCYV